MSIDETKQQIEYSIIIEAALNALYHARRLYSSYLETIGINPIYDNACYNVALASISINAELERVRDLEKKQQNIA